MSDKTYNGWSNYETWAVKLWIDNEEGSYNYWQEQTREAWSQALTGRAYASQTRKERAAVILCDLLKSEHEEAQPVVTGVFSDLLNAAMSEVDWYEIAESMLDDAELDDEDDEDEDDTVTVPPDDEDEDDE